MLYRDAMSPRTADRIAAEASAILRAEGADAVSMRRVASAVGITPMAIYRHFPNREALLRAVAARGWAQLAATSPATHGQQCQPQGGPHGGIQPEDRRNALRAALDALLDFAVTQPGLYGLLTGHASDAGDFRSEDSPLLGRVAAAVDEAMHRGRLAPDDVDEVAVSLVALIHGLVALHQAGWLGLSDGEFRGLCQSAVGRLLRGVGPERTMDECGCC